MLVKYTIFIDTVECRHFARQRLRSKQLYNSRELGNDCEVSNYITAVSK
jgi:hypothetical protein